MAISVPSRFSCLKIEDEEFSPAPGRSTKKKQEKQTKKIATVPNTNKKPSSRQSQAPSNQPAKKKRGKGKEDKQWEEWKRKDDEFVNENFQQDLQSAMLQSKIEYEHQKKNPVPLIITTQDKSKKKKSKTMSLEQFLERTNPVAKETEEASEEDEGDFFANVSESTKKELQREEVEEKRRERTNNIEEVIILSQCQEKLESERAKNVQLAAELEKARAEIAAVKERNTTLCSMLSQGEMKDKATLLLDLVRVTAEKEELVEEVARLHERLEQERSSTKANINSSASDSHSAKHKEKQKKKKN